MTPTPPASIEEHRTHRRRRLHEVDIHSREDLEAVGPFELTFEMDWSVSLRHGSHELAILDYRHPTVPEGFRKPVQALLLNVEVDDVDEVYARLIGQAGLPVHLDLRSEAFGQRPFIIADPNGVLVDVITNIPPSAENAALYTGGAA
jgi:hypothetical protein